MARFRRVRWVLLCEDLEQELLFREALTRKFGQPPKVVRGGRGGGFTFVLRQIPTEISILKRKAGQAYALVVVIDGDEEGHRGRLEALREKGGIRPGEYTSQLATCIPCRNIETWILWLNGDHTVTEDEDHETRLRKDPNLHRLARSAGKVWFAAPPATTEATSLPALAKGREEVDRLVGLTRAQR